MSLADIDRAEFGRAQTVEIAAPAEAVWALVTDVTRTGKGFSLVIVPASAADPPG